MGKLDTYTKNRIEGLAWALKIIDKEESLEKGVDMLRKEIQFRNVTPVPLEIPAEGIRKVNIELTNRVLNTVLVVVLKVLEDEYGWKKQRLQGFVGRFFNNAEDLQDLDPYGEKYAEISHYAEYFKETYGIEFTEEAINTMQKVEEENRADRIPRIQFDVIEKHLKNSYPDALEHLRKTVLNKD